MAAFKWEGGVVPTIGAHSRVKLNIYASYIENYIVERVQLGMDRFRLNIVDGFCGGGVFSDGSGEHVSGSPLTIVKAIEQAEKKINLGRNKPVFIEYKLYCFDHEQKAIDSLREQFVAQGYEPCLGRSIILQRANFSQIAGRLIKGLSEDKAKTIFILDQLGYGAVSFDTLRAIFSTLERPEVILTFGYEWLTSFVSSYPEIRKRFINLGVDPPCEADYMASIGGKFGVPQFIQKHLIAEFRRVSPFFTPFFITSRSSVSKKGSNLKYWLVHLAAHERANDVMKKVHWSVPGHSAHYLGPGLEMLGFDPNKAEIPEYLFGDVDVQTTKNALIEDIPKYVGSSDNWLSAGELWIKTCNETPSTSAMQGTALQALARMGEIELSGAGGGAKRGGAVVRTDRFRLKSQSSFYFMKTGT